MLLNDIYHLLDTSAYIYIIFIYVKYLHMYIYLYIYIYIYHCCRSTQLVNPDGVSWHTPSKKLLGLLIYIYIYIWFMANPFLRGYLLGLMFNGLCIYIYIYDMFWGFVYFG